MRKVRDRRRRTLWIAGWLMPALLAAVGPTTFAQHPAPIPDAACDDRGPIARKLAHVNFVFHDKIAGWPEYFVEPPLGYHLRRNNALNVAKADPHRQLLYRSDFVGDTATLSPSGAQRLSLMAARLQGGPAPLLVEWTPGNPALAEARKASVEELFRRAGMPLVAGRVRVSPSPYPGMPGAEAANNNDTLILRNADAARAFSRTPVPQVTLIGSGGP